MSEMSEGQFKELVKELSSEKDLKIVIDAIKEELKSEGITIVADNNSMPKKMRADCSKHDKKYKRKIDELQGIIANQSRLIRGYDGEILELKAQCQNLTQIERFSYKSHNKSEAEIPTEPIKIADWLIDRHIEQVEKMSASPSDLDDMRKLQIDSLRQIAEHLLVFCSIK